MGISAFGDGLPRLIPLPVAVSTASFAAYAHVIHSNSGIQMDHRPHHAWRGNLVCIVGACMFSVLLVLFAYQVCVISLLACFKVAF